MLYFGKNLVYLRKSGGLTHRQVADILNVSETAYINYETEYSKPELDTIHQISNFYRLPMEQIIYHDLEYIDSTIEMIEEGDLDLQLLNYKYPKAITLEEKLAELKRTVRDLRKEFDDLRQELREGR